MITSLPRGFLHSFVKGGGSGGGSTSVTSVFTRTGDVVAATGDYTDLEITSSPTNVLTTTGDVLYASAAHTLARLGIGTSGQVLTVVGGIPAWTTIAAGGGGEVGYDQITSNVTVTSTTEASGTTIITCAPHTFDGSPVVVYFYSPGIAISGGPAFTNVSLFESTTEITILGGANNGIISTALSLPCFFAYRFTPSAGAHTYLITAYKSAGTVTVTGGAGGTAAVSPCFVRFVKV